MLSFLAVFLVLAAISITSISTPSCPCSSASRLTAQRPANQSICLLRPADASAVFGGLLDTIASFHHKERFPIEIYASVPDDAYLRCRVVVEVADSVLPARSLCPGRCRPPRLTVPLSVLTIQPLALKSLSKVADMALTCSLTLRDLVQGYRSLRPARPWILHLLQTLIERRMMECYEDIALAQKITPRPVDGLIIWIGSTERHKRMERQHDALQGLPYHTTGSVIGWTATDGLYPCNGTRCLGSNKRYAGLLPKSDVNLLPAGWGCAQRRPLRSLSHTLLLFAPNYIVLMDDDTFFNYPLFHGRLGHLLRGNMTNQPIFLGEAMGKTGESGHISTMGFFVGGSGYILGKEVVSRLVSKQVAAFRYEHLQAKFTDLQEKIQSDAYRSVKQIWYLSILTEGMESATEGCISVREGEEEASIAVRLVDYCVNLMANENTCQHSDHSLGRCLVYGARAIPMPVVCHQPGPASDSAGLTGMCFMAPACDVNQHFTCHRYEAGMDQGKLTARRTSRSKGHYKQYSSMMVGNASDTYL